MKLGRRVVEASLNAAATSASTRTIGFRAIAYTRCTTYAGTRNGFRVGFEVRTSMKRQARLQAVP